MIKFLITFLLVLPLSSIAQESKVTAAKVIFDSLNVEADVSEGFIYKWSQKSVGGLTANKGLNLRTKEVTYSVSVSSSALDPKKIYHSYTGSISGMDFNGTTMNFKSLYVKDGVNPHSRGIKCVEEIQAEKVSYLCDITL